MKREEKLDYGDNVNGGVKLNFSFEPSPMTSRLCQFIILPRSGLGVILRPTPHVRGGSITPGAPKFLRWFGGVVL